MCIFNVLTFGPPPKYGSHKTRQFGPGKRSIWRGELTKNLIYSTLKVCSTPNTGRREGSLAERGRKRCGGVAEHRNLHSLAEQSFRWDVNGLRWVSSLERIFRGGMRLDWRHRTEARSLRLRPKARPARWGARQTYEAVVCLAGGSSRFA
jgi:hypothetical protein